MAQIHAAGSSFDPSAISGEIQSLHSDEGTTIDTTEYNDFLEFLQRLAHSGVDVSHEPNLETAMTDLDSAVNSVATPSGAVFSDQQVTSCVQKLVSEGHCTNLFAFLSQMHQDSVDFSHDTELQTTMNNISVEVSQGLGPF
ncbi:hypothetical protein LTR10_015332 [Elasticomyces elasticus]|uniref:Uncharacterized protein n=1 Tax=Exophiala sideris TaxID=1016849 RepID=A0ABR0JJU2_9EURO|nr:hypothetical protein LTR10_015332 [Elasticomyces elasticus]KAK5030267.1 hypothetical protein LTR13_008286 [Exophiala sideris]KAK5035077.1 hypothetical protein LTS07_002512 [Exophiala sideris]KAK5066000.1 hypothetical protein LTR69_002517 [Exophiala sideris]KAK5178332.1 hypothetical protein LTR44_009208 [Eurotiomycetes sp. CCFEE 6388]